jgi:hypothetical protein
VRKPSEKLKNAGGGSRSEALAQEVKVELAAPGWQLCPLYGYDSTTTTRCRRMRVSPFDRAQLEELNDTAILIVSFELIEML